MNKSVSVVVKVINCMHDGRDRVTLSDFPIWKFSTAAPHVDG